MLTAYVWQHYRHLFTDFDRKVSGRIIFEMKTQHTPPELRDERFERVFGALDPAVTSALEEGHWAFLRRVRDRILAEDGDQVFINRCPVCRRIVRTPKAKQCLWCRHDWHVTT
jgi:hypothetical protein